MKRKTFKLSLHAAAAGAGLMAMTPAIAYAQEQDPAPAASEDTGVIVVTARRVDESLKDVPVSVTVASQVELEQKSISNPETLDRLDPALSLNTAGGSRQNFSPSIRAQTGTRSVISYFAEVPQFRPQFFDLRSIQILKGPQGTLFGETATGGVLLFTPTRPGNEFEGYFSVEAGNYNYIAAEGAVTLPIASDVWSIRLAAQTRKRQGYTRLYYGQVSAGSTDADNLDTMDLRLSSRLTPFDGLTIDTVFAYSQVKLNGTGYIKSGVYDYLPSLRAIPADNPTTAARFTYFSGINPPAGTSFYQLEQAVYQRQLQLGPRVTFASNAQATDQRFWGVSNIITLDITDQLTFKNVTGLIGDSYGPNSGANPDASEYPTADNLGNRGGICILGVSPSDCREDNATTFTNEAQLQATLFDGRATLQGGFYYRSLANAPWVGPSQFATAANSSAVPAASCTAFGLAGTPCLTLTRTTSKSYAVYGQATVEIVDGLRLTGGLRQTWDKPVVTESTAGPVVTRSFNGATINLSPFGAAPLNNARVTRFETPENRGLSYTFTADWKITDDLLLWGSHRKGFRGGGVNRSIPTTDANYTYGPETVKDFEVGLRGSGNLGSMPVSATLVGYRSKYDDIQRGTFGFVGTTYVSSTQNVARATIQGVEFSLDIKPSAYFELSAGLAYTDAKFDEWKEVSTCARETFRAGCNNVANATVPVFIDHVAGTVTANGVTQTYRPDLFAQVPKVRWSLTPVVHLGFLGRGAEGASLTANISYSSSYANQDSNWVRGLQRKDVLSPARTLIDLRFDWRDLPFGGPGFGFYAAITNLTNWEGPVAVLDSTAACDCVLANYSEPRMAYAGISYRF